MDMNAMMQNPQMMAMAQMMMQDPEVMEMMQRPGMMEKLQAAMSNPASAMGDPDVMKIAMKLQSMGMGGGGGGGSGGGLGGMGGGGYGAGAPAAGSSSGSSNIQHITTPAQHAAILSSAGDRLVVINYSTTWCGPCKAIAPLVTELAGRYGSPTDGKVVFVKVDGDASRDLVLQQGVQGFPTFEFYVRGQKMESFAGADREKLTHLVEEYGNYTAPVVCPYKHFPLKDSELVKYAEIKWEMVAPKFRELNDKLPAAAASTTEGQATAKLSEEELKDWDGFLKIIQDRGAYHTTHPTALSYKTLNKIIGTWPKTDLAPALNTLRMAVMHPEVAQFYATASLKKTADDLLSPLLRHAHAAEKPVTALLIVRTLVNTFSRRILGKAVVLRFEEVLESMAGLYKKHADENLRLSIIALYINFAILMSESPQSYEGGKVLLLTSVQEALQQSPRTSALVYRSIVILGTCVYQDANAAELARDLDIIEDVKAAAKDATVAQDQPTQAVMAEFEKAIAK